MMGRTRTDWARIRYNVLITFCAICISTCPAVSASSKQKRQIFREQVQPHSGGRIPTSAFRADRLALNQLNKEGITVPDGFLLEHRRQQIHPYPYHERNAKVIKVIQAPDGRYVPSYGREFNNYPDTVDTTYVIREPHRPQNYRNQFVFPSIITRPQSQPYFSTNYKPQQEPKSLEAWLQQDKLLLNDLDQLWLPTLDPIILNYPALFSDWAKSRGQYPIVLHNKYG